MLCLPAVCCWLSYNPSIPLLASFLIIIIKNWEWKRVAGRVPYAPPTPPSHRFHILYLFRGSFFISFHSLIRFLLLLVMSLAWSLWKDLKRRRIVKLCYPLHTADTRVDTSKHLTPPLPLWRLYVRARVIYDACGHLWRTTVIAAQPMAQPSPAQPFYLCRSIY